MGSLNRSLLLRILLISSEGLERKESLELLKDEQGQGASNAWDLVVGKYGREGILTGLDGSSEKKIKELRSIMLWCCLWR